MRRALLLGASCCLLVACGRGEVNPLGMLGGGADASAPDDGGPGRFDGGPLPGDGGPVPSDGGPVPSDGGPPPPPPDGGPPPPPPDGGPGPQCRSAVDCFQSLGPPPPCPRGQRGRWECLRGTCVPTCPPERECRTDCDCPFSLSCAQGNCVPLGRNNQCCLNPNCPPGDTCVQPDGTQDFCPQVPPPPPDAGVPGDGGPGPVDAGPGPDGGMSSAVGDPCMGPMSCGSGRFCIDANQGFPDGYCTAQCGRGGACPTGADCVRFGQGQDLCLDQCMVNADCRTGYGCIQLGIGSSRVCWPTSPGSTNPNGDPVGASCQGDNDCATGLSCPALQWPGNYCTIAYCDPVNNPCPTGSSCYAFPGLYSLCLAECPNGGTQSTCRSGYYCLGPTGQPGACIPN